MDNVFLFRPSHDALLDLLEQHADEPLSYDEALVGESRALAASGPPPGYATDATAGVIGAGGDVYARAVSALCSLRQFDLGWTEAASLGQGKDMAVAIAMRVLGTWVVGLTRVIAIGQVDDVVQESDSDPRPREFEMVFGTLGLHLVEGEERFSVRWNGEPDGDVVVAVESFSRPAGWMATAGWPVGRMYQLMFGDAVLARIAEIVAGKQASEHAVGVFDV